MKIIHITNYYTNKLKYQEYYLMREHERMGHEVYCITSNKNFPFADYDESIYGPRNLDKGLSVEDNIKIIRLTTIFEISSRVISIGLLDEIDKISPDTIICHGITNFFALKLLNLNAKFKLIYDDHMTEELTKKNRIGSSFYYLFRKFYAKKFERRASSIIGISNNTVKVINEIYGINSDKVMMIPLGVDISKFYVSSEKRVVTRKSFNIPEDFIVITYTGKINESKRVDILIDAVNQIESDNIFLLIVGNGNPTYIKKINAQLKNFEHRFLFSSSVPHNELPNIFNASDIAVWPYSATISTLEASSCGIPIICPDFLTERYCNNNGFGVVPGNVPQLVERLTQMIFDEKLRTGMGKNGRILIEREMSWRKIAERFLEDRQKSKSNN